MTRSIFGLFLIAGIVGSVISLPPKVSWVHVLAATNDTLLFGWRRPNDDASITHYAVELYHHNGSLVVNNTMDIKAPGRNNHMYIYVSLDPGETYAFKVQACNEIGCGLWSEPLEGYTKDGIPDPPKNVQMLCNHDFIEDRDTVTVTWEATVHARGTIMSYNITLYSRAQYKDENGLNVEKKASKIEIIDAKLDTMLYKTTVLPNTEYTVQMCTINKSGCGPMTNISADTQCKTLKNENEEFKLILNTDEGNPASDQQDENSRGF